MCLTYLAHLESKVASLTSALKDKEVVQEHIAEVKMYAREQTQRIEEELCNTKSVGAPNPRLTKLWRSQNAVRQSSIHTVAFRVHSHTYLVYQNSWVSSTRKCSMITDELS